MSLQKSDRERVSLKRFLLGALLCLLFTAFGGAIGVYMVPLAFVVNSSGEGGPPTEEKPLYWVAPMDPDYRRDKPGQSPMGMDLIPVYDEGENKSDADPGAIFISPDVVNNLGVRTGIVERKPWHSEIITVGYVKYDEDLLVHIHPRVSGWVEKLFIKAEGDLVVKGEALYSLYSPELVNAQEELVLAVKRKNDRLIKSAENRLQAFNINGKFIQKLKKDFEIERAVTFFSSSSGVVESLHIREGFYVKPGTTMLSIGSLDRVWVEAEVFERQAPFVQLHSPVVVSLDYLPQRTWRGRVDYIYPTVDVETRTVRVRIPLDNLAGKLKPNMFAQVVIRVDGESEILTIPREALIRTGNQNRVVLALGDGYFKSVEVKVGRSNRQDVEVLKGLDPGELVVTSAQFLLDSESSKTSDFKRIDHSEGRHD